MKILLSIVTLWTLLIVTLQELKVLMPFSSVNQFKILRQDRTDTEFTPQNIVKIEYNLANFGDIPYGATIEGLLSTTKTDLCEEDLS